MKFGLGQPVLATDGAFGEVGDIVVDPGARSVTHIVVEPKNQHHQARLVPIGLVTVDGDAVKVGVDIAHLRSLQQVSDNEYLPLGQPVDVGPDWDLGTEDLLLSSYGGAEYGGAYFDDDAEVYYDRIPRGECEIRNSSSVWTADDHFAGTVEGFIANGDHLAGVVVRAGRRGLRHYVVVPMHAVAKVRTDMITLELDRDRFRALPVTDDIFGSADPPSTLTRLEHHVAKTIRSWQTELGSRFGRR